MNLLQRPWRPHQAALLIKIASGGYKGLEHEPDFFATLDDQRGKLGHSLLPFIATPGDEHTPFRDCIFFRKGTNRSAIAAVAPGGGSNWMAAEELEELKGGSGSQPKNWMGSRCFLDCQTPRRWLTARCNNAHSVLHPTWKDELGSEKK